MTENQTVTIHAVPHRSPQVQKVGLPIDHRYLEECWAPVLGPTSVFLLRRIATLWEEAEPAVVSRSELGQSIGLGKGAGRNSPLQQTLDRLERFGFLRQSATGGTVAVATTVGPLSDRQLERVPEWNRQRHECLWGHHLDGLAAQKPTTPTLGLPLGPTSIAAPPAVDSAPPVPAR